MKARLHHWVGHQMMSSLDVNTPNDNMVWRPADPPGTLMISSPLKMTVLPEGYAFMYEGLDTQELQLGFSLPIPVISWFKFVLAQADYDHQVMVYQFNHENLLVASAGDDTHFDLGNSMAVQPIITVQLMFDTTAVENEIVDFVQWPAFCLRPLPETLNRHTSLNGGVAGIEQRGTAPNVGQRTLEMHK